MLNREIPFRPKLEGQFRVRFYSAVSTINEKTTPLEIEEIVNSELKWVQEDCIYNLDQRKKYRAVWMLFRDLTRASWASCFREGVLYMRLTFVLATLKTAKCRDLSNRPAVPLVA